MKCKYCGRPLDPEWQFCNYCGEKQRAQRQQNIQRQQHPQRKQPSQKMQNLQEQPYASRRDYAPRVAPPAPQPAAPALQQLRKWMIPAVCIVAIAVLIICIVILVNGKKDSGERLEATEPTTAAITSASEETTEEMTEAETEAEPTEETQPPFVTDCAWAQSYYDTILAFEEDHADFNPEKNVKYRLLYIDDNEIPELFIQAGDATALYTIVDDEAKRIYSANSAAEEKLIGVRTRCGTYLMSRTSDEMQRYSVNTLKDGEATEIEAYRAEGDTYTLNGAQADLVGFTQFVRAKQAAYQLTDIPVYKKAELLDALLNAADGKNIPEMAGEEETVETQEYTEDETLETDDETGEKHYKVVAGNMTWSEAQAACKAAGGHLAYIKSAEDYAAVKAAIGDTSLKYLWVGGKTSIASDGTVTAKWADGSSTSYLDSAGLWFGHEPSGKDGDTLEPYMMLWNVGGWSFNDNSDSCVSIYESGTMGYILETYE